ISTERQQRDIADGQMTGEADDQIETRDQDPVDCCSGADQRPVVIADERQDHGNREDAGKWRKLRQDRTEAVRFAASGGGRDRGHHTLRVVDEPNKPCGAASNTTMNSANTATDEKMPPTRKFAACWNSPSARPPI